MVIGPGAKPGLFFPTLALVEPGDEVIYPDPGFPTYAAMICRRRRYPGAGTAAGREQLFLRPAGFRSSLNPRTRLIILNSPANPTGGVIPLADLEHIAAAAQQFDCWVIPTRSTPAWLMMACTVQHRLPARHGERTIIVDGFSKTYAMTGWRLGYGIMPDALAERVDLLLTHSVGCTATFTQYAGLAALQARQERLTAMVEDYQQRRDLMVPGSTLSPACTVWSPRAPFTRSPTSNPSACPPASRPAHPGRGRRGPTGGRRLSARRRRLPAEVLSRPLRATSRPAPGGGGLLLLAKVPKSPTPILWTQPGHAHHRPFFVHAHLL